MVSVKRGEAQTALLVKMITVLTLGIVLLVLIKNMGIVNVGIAEKSTCKESVRQYIQLKSFGNNKLMSIAGGGTLASSKSIKCPVQLKTINPSDDGRAKKQLADAMFDCFDQFGENKYDLFDTNRGTTNHYCIVCSKITFTGPTKKIEGFPSYLSEEFAPGKKITYFQYFKGEKVAEGESQALNKCVKTAEGLIKCEPAASALKNAPFVIDTSKDHAILFTYSKSTGWWDHIVAGEIGGTVGVVVGGAVAGFFTGGVGWVVAGAALVGSAGAGFGLVAAPNLQSNWQAGVILLPYGQNVKSYLNCDEIPIK